MPKLGQQLVGKVGMMLGVVVIAGSVVGGIALAADLGRAADQVESTVPMSDDDPTTPPVNSAGPQVSAPEPSTTRPAPTTSPKATQPQPPPTSARPPRTPTPTLTCWPGPGSHPEGIEDCEDH